MSTSDSTSIVPYVQKGLTKVTISLKITEKLLFERSENYFNLGFAALYSGVLNSVTENFSQAISNDLLYSRRRWHSLKVKEYPQDLQTAIEYFTKAISLSNSYKIAYCHRGIAKYQLRDYQEAVYDFSSAIELDPDYIEAIVFRSKAKFRAYDIFNGILSDEMIEKCQEYNLGPDNEHIILMERLDSMDLHDFNGIIQLLTAALKIYPDDPDHYFYRANSKEQLLDMDSAIKDYNKCIELDPNDWWAVQNRADLKMKLMNYTGAIDDFTKVLQINPVNHNIYRLRSEARKANGDLEGAESDLRLFEENGGCNNHVNVTLRDTKPINQ